MEFYLIEELTWLSENFKTLSVKYKQMCVDSFVRSVLAGETIEPTVFDVYKKYIASQRKKYYQTVHTDLDLLKFMINNDIIEKAMCSKIFGEIQKAGDAELVAAMMEYMNKNGISVEGKNNATDNFCIEALDRIVLSPEEAKLDWTYSTVELGDGIKGISIDSYKGRDRIVTVPVKIGIKAVVYINEDAFSPEKARLTKDISLARRRIKEVTIPEGIVCIGFYAFRGSNVEKVNLPTTLKEIESGAFADCNMLSEIRIPDQCSFGGSFVGCKLLENSSKMVIIGDKLDSSSSAKKTSIQIPKSVTHVCAYAF